MPDSSISCDPAARSYTALFVLLGRLFAVLGGERGKDIVYPVNRPGQNVVECYTLAGLAFGLLTGLFAVHLSEFFGANIWSYALAMPLATLGTFVSLHALLFGFAFIYHLLKFICLFPASAPQQVPVGVYLLFFTGLALLMVQSGECVFIIIAAPWLIAVFLNSGCALILFAENFVSQIRGGVE